jgi:glutaredoxin
LAARNARATHPAVSQQIEQMLKARNIDFDFEPNVKIAEIRDAEGNQVRLREHRATKEQVAKYATAMKHGATFPAIVLNDRLEKIDGNTRLAAREKNGEDTIAAYICHGMTPIQARSLSVELNQSNGLAMTEEEIRRFVNGAVQENQDPDVRTLARMTGVHANKIGRWIAESEFIKRAKDEEVDDRHVEALPPSTRAALHVTRLATVFRDLSALAAQAKIPASQVKRIVAAANGAASEAEALAIVENERAARADDIRTVASGLRPKDRKSKGSAQHIGGLVRFGVDDLLDVAPEKQFETFHRLKLISDRLAEVVVRAEREWDLTPPPEEPEGDTVSAGGVAVATS